MANAKAATSNAVIDQDRYVAEFRAAAHEAVEWIAKYYESVREYPVLSRNSPGQLVDTLPRSGPEQGEPFEAIMRDFDRVIVPAVTHWNHPGFLAYFGCTGSTPAVVGEMLAAALNTNGLH